MKILEEFLTQGKAHGRPGDKITPEGITIHYVGNPKSSAAGNRNWFENGAGGALASAHYIVGLDGEVIYIIPENERANHAGKPYGPKWGEMAKTNNMKYIGIECCHPDASGEFNAATRAALVELCMDICRRYGFDPRKDIVRHYDITGKECPRFYVRNPDAWDQLIDDIAVAVTGETETVFVSFPGGVTTVPAEFKENTWWITLADGQRVKVRDVLDTLGFIPDWNAKTNCVNAIVKGD